MAKKEHIPPVILFDIEMGYRDQHDMHSHDYHEFFLTLEGRGHQYTEFGTMKMRKGDLFFFPAGQAHHGSGTANGYCLGGVIYLYEGQFYGKRRERESRQVLRAMTEYAKGGQSKFNLDQAGRKKVAGLFNQMLEEDRLKKPGYQCVIESLMEQVLIAILRHCRLPLAVKSASENSIAVQKIGDLLRFLDNHYRQALDVSQVAQMVNMSRSYFHLQFKTVTGKTFTRYLNELRVRGAEKMLRENAGLSADSVAVQCGFNSVSHFYRVLKEVTGKTPKCIRGGQ